MACLLTNCPFRHASPRLCRREQRRSRAARNLLSVGQGVDNNPTEPSFRRLPMNTFSKILVVAAAVAISGATVNSAFAHGGHGGGSGGGSYGGSYRPSYGSYHSSYDYNAYDDSSDYGYGGSYGWNYRGGYGHGGHDRRR